TDVVLVADTDVADFALAAGGEKGVICAQCGAGPSTYPPSDAPTIRVINGNAEVWLFRGARTVHNGLVGGSSPPGPTTFHWINLDTPSPRRGYRPENRPRLSRHF